MLTPQETQEAAARLTDAERTVYLAILNEGTVCAHQMADDERRIASRLVRRRLIRSETAPGCRARHYF